MEEQSKENDLFSIFKKKVEDAISLVSQIPAEQKQEVWKFWGLMSKSLKLLTQICADEKSTVCSDNEVPKTKRKRGRPKGQKKKIEEIEKDNIPDQRDAKILPEQEEFCGSINIQQEAESLTIQNVDVYNVQVIAATEVVQNVDNKGYESPACSSDHATVDDMVSSFNLDFSDLMSIPSSVEGPRSHMSNANLQSPDPMHLENVMTPVSNKEEITTEAIGENVDIVGEDKQSPKQSELNTNATEKENIVPVNDVTSNHFEDNAAHSVVTCDESISIPEPTKSLKRPRRSSRRRKSNLKNDDIYKYESNIDVLSDQIDNDNDVGDHEDEIDVDDDVNEKSKNKKRKRRKQPKEEIVEADLVCRICDTKLSSMAALAVHNRKHSGDRPYICKQCGSSFTTKGNMIRHIRTHTGKRPYECTTCKKRFAEEKTLKVHLRTHTGERPYKCNVCGQTFTQSGVLQNHMHIHTGHQGHLCDWCGKSFRQKSNLTVHVKRHLNSREYACETCHYSFFAKGDLDRHKLKHSGEKPYLCELCPKSFTRLQYLNEHMNQHLGNKPHTCKKCAATFFDLSTYHRHIRKHRTEGKSKISEKLKEDSSSTGHIIMTTGNTLSQNTLQQLEAVINQEAERIQQQNNEQSYQTIILSNDSQVIDASDNNSTIIQPGTSYISKGDEEMQQEVYHISVEPNFLSNDPANLIATVDFSAINLLANATTKQFSS